MALSTRIVTRHTTLFAALIAGALVGVMWLVAALILEPSADSELHLSQPLDPGILQMQIGERPPALAFPPSEVRPSDRLCGWTADQVFLHYDAMTPPTRDMHVNAIVGLTEAYIDMRCPSRIHDGNWDITAQILGLGLVRERIESRPWFDEHALRFDPRSSDLVPAAATTFEILAPHQMCRDATRGHAQLDDECLSALGWFD